MRKLKLQLDELQVDSFETTVVDREPGTVVGAQNTDPPLTVFLWESSQPTGMPDAAGACTFTACGMYTECLEACGDDVSDWCTSGG